MQRVTPERFIAERVEAEGMSPIFEHLGRVVSDHVVKAPLVGGERAASRRYPGHRRDQGGDADQGHRESGTENPWEDRHSSLSELRWRSMRSCHITPYSSRSWPSRSRPSRSS